MTSVTTAASDTTRAVIDQFNDAVNRRDIDGLRATITDDCIFESPGAPDGGRYVGGEMVNVFAEVMSMEGEGPFDAEEIVVCGDRAVVRWVHTWDHGEGQRGHVRGIDLFRVRNGRVCEKLSYVKG
ncbi:MAG: nuclear transport factor 2 family protein [Actinobacteria bacterium]|nr:nuclear transport factor 2 family protein [Actinomycetota bacterium]